jgi:hypothetical protein
VEEEDGRGYGDYGWSSAEREKKRFRVQVMLDVYFHIAAKGLA